MLTFQQLIFTLQQYWSEQGCVILQPYDMEVGAGTFHPATFLASIGPEPIRAAYVQPSRRPADGRYGENPNRMQHYFQFQVVMKPSPLNFQDLYIGSLKSLGFNFLKDDIRFVEDNWESPTLGAWGLGWEVWLNGMEVSQFTYFQQAGGLDCRPVTGEITYGLERIAMYIQEVDSLFDLVWNDGEETWTYGDIYKQNEIEQSAYNFEQANVDTLFKQFEFAEKTAENLIESNLPLPAYEQVLRASHTFNLLDARQAIGVTERVRYIARVRNLARGVANEYYQSRERLGFPRLKNHSRIDEQESKKAPTKGKVNDSVSRLLVVEIGTEELPPTALKSLSEAFSESIVHALKEAGMLANQVMSWQSYASPRRIAVKIENVLSSQPDQTQQRRGPSLNASFDADGSPTPAAIGFARSCGVQVSELDKLKTDKGEWLVYTQTASGQSIDQILSEVLDDVMRKLPIPKRMRWSDFEHEFVRPVHWLLAMHGDKVLDFEVLNLSTSRLTCGHRFHAPEILSIASAEQYAKELKERGYVLADYAERSASIEQQVSHLAQQSRFKALVNQELLNEVVGLTEWPVALQGSFDPRFLKLPKEVLVETMTSHQKYFCLVDQDNKIAPYFVVIANLQSQDPDRVRKGNERVLGARLADAEFFWDSDQKIPLVDRFERLETVVFHKRLGSILDKSKRIIELAKRISEYQDLDVEATELASRLCKTDLVTEMVAELPKLQGVVGRYYALAQGIDAPVAEAIEQHYLPRFAGDSLPPRGIASSVAIADRIDTLCGIFACGDQPTGERDPFSLRRASLGVLRIVIENDMEVDLRDLLDWSMEIYAEQGWQNIDTGNAVKEHLIHYIFERSRQLMQSRGYAVDLWMAAMGSLPTRPLDLLNRIAALQKLIAENRPAAESIVAINKRISNILQKTPKEPIACKVFNEKLIQHESERELFIALRDMESDVVDDAQNGRYSHGFNSLFNIRSKIDRFFDDVMVNDEDPKIRNNRVTLLKIIYSMFLQKIDFTKLRIDKP